MPSPHPAFQGKVVLVTGGATGIGLASARQFARHGAQVVIAARRSQTGLSAMRQIETEGGNACFIRTDLAEPAQITALHDQILDRFGQLDIAFNNAGFQEPKALLADQDPAQFDPVFNVNVRAVFLSLQRQIGIMQAAGGGTVIVNASVSGLRNPNPGFALYSASKAAVISLTRAAAMEAAPHGVRINAVAPGRVVTDMMLNSKVADMSAVAAGLPLRRMGTPQELAEAVVWLASDAASYVVGHVLCADGGFMSA